MNKNRLLLNQKRFLSFSNYKHYIKHSINDINKIKVIEKSKISNNNLILLNRFKKSHNENAHNVYFLRNKSNSLIENNIRLFSFNKNKTNLNLSINNSSENYNSNKNTNDQLFNNKKNIYKEHFEKINELLKRKNSSRFYVSKKLSQIIEGNNNCDSINTKKRTSLYEKIFRLSPTLDLNDKDDNDKKILTKRKSENLSSRKINKELFSKHINGIIKSKNGRKKVKYKIIGTLTTEPNHNILSNS